MPAPVAPPELPVVALVLLAAVLHAGWNAVVKTGADRVLTMALVIGVGAAGAALALPFVPPPAPASWGFLLLSGLVHIGYFAFLLEAYRFGDLSRVYPIARGAAPLLVALGAAVFAGERLGAAQLGAVALVAGAIASLALERGGLRGDGRRSLLLALATAVIIATYTIVDGLGVRRADGPLGYILWLFVLDAVPLLAYAALTRGARVGAYLRAHWPASLVAGVMCGGAYGLAIWALSLGAMAHVSALRETSVLFAALIGGRLLGEPFGRRRLAAAFAVVAGIVWLYAA
jgi:drug/metabolite transporter (DMT)-like permease